MFLKFLYYNYSSYIFCFPFSPPMYLTRSSSIFDQILRKIFNDSIKTIDEKRFLYTRLELLDQQYCLETDQHLWQSYLDIGLQKHIWPVSISFYYKLFLHYIFSFLHNQGSTIYYGKNK